MEYAYRFPAVKGIQANKEYYIAMIPLRMIPTLFPTGDEDYVLPEYRAQRRLNETRVPVISRYILDNRDNYVFSALAASIDGTYQFLSNDKQKSIGVLEVALDAKFLINDGQHRKAAICEALSEAPELGEETIPIVFFGDINLARSQQIFTDLNKNAVRTSNSISELYDSRDPLAVVTRNVVNRVDFLNRYTDKEKDILGKYSSSLFTLNTIYNANRSIISRNVITDETECFLEKFWRAVSLSMPQWVELQEGNITKKELREKYISVQAIVIQALGRLGNWFYLNHYLDEGRLSELRKVNWRRSSEIWKYRAIDNNGRIISNKNAAILICNVLKKKMKITLSEDEKEAEDILQSKKY